MRFTTSLALFAVAAAVNIETLLKLQHPHEEFIAEQEGGDDGAAAGGDAAAGDDGNAETGGDEEAAADGDGEAAAGGDDEAAADGDDEAAADDDDALSMSADGEYKSGYDYLQNGDDWNDTLEHPDWVCGVGVE